MRFLQAIDTDNYPYKQQSIPWLYALAIILAFVLLLGNIPTASANHGGLPACKNGHVCLYKDHFFDGGIASYAGKDPDYSNGFWPDNTWDVVNHGRIGSINDAISSLKNLGNRCSTKHFFDKNYKGNSVFLKRGFQIKQLFRSNDKFSSHRWVC